VPSFDVVIPSLPGFPLSTAPTRLGLSVFEIADLWAQLMQRLGYPKFYAHGGDIGAGVSTALGLRHPNALLGLHMNYVPGSYRPYVARSADLTDVERAFLERRAAWTDAEGAYAHVQSTKPDTLGPALNDSPVGLAAWIVDKYRTWSDCSGDVERRFSKTELLTTISLYWFTQSMPSAIRLYWESRRRPMQFVEGQAVRVPVAIAHFPQELPMPPRAYVERGYHITRWTEMARGGHFAAAEEPALLAQDIQAFCQQVGAALG
jgi:pimeloyl-ACP methyl ester carboxylesterase